MPESPTLTAVGLGPGDPELVTIKGMRAIQAADVIFTPRSQDDAASIALQIAAPWVTDRQTIVPVTTPMTRDAETLQAAWRDIAGVIGRRLSAAGQARRGVYLILGDPLLYGTFTYIAAELAARFPDLHLDVIPGVTSFAAAAAKTHTPLAAAGDRLAIIPAGRDATPARLRALLADFSTLILLKVGPVFPQIMAALEELELVDQAVYVERLGLPAERIAQGAALRTLVRQRQPYLSLLVVKRKEAGLPPVPPAPAWPDEQPVYPLNLSQVAGKRAVVVGGGPVAERKVKGLLAAQIEATVISPTATNRLRQWADAGRIGWRRRPYQSGDLAGAYLVFAATDQRAVNAQVAREARALGLLSNIADAPADGDFHLPAIHRRPGLIVAVSTAGHTPRRAVQVRNRIAEWLEAEWLEKETKRKK